MGDGPAGQALYVPHDQDLPLVTGKGADRSRDALCLQPVQHRVLGGRFRTRLRFGCRLVAPRDKQPYLPEAFVAHDPEHP